MRNGKKGMEGAQENGEGWLRASSSWGCPNRGKLARPIFQAACWPTLAFRTHCVSLARREAGMREVCDGSGAH